MDLLTPDFGLFFWTLIAFLFVLFILRKYAWKPILDSLDKREKGISDSIATAQRIKDEMGKMQSDNEKLMLQAREERSQLLKEAKELKDRIVTEAKDQAKTEANRIIVEAQQQIKQQQQAAMTEVKNEISNMAIQVAEKLLRKQLANGQDQNNYINTLSDDIKLN